MDSRIAAHTMIEVKTKGFFTKNMDMNKLLEIKVKKTTHVTFLRFLQSFDHNNVRRRHTVGAAVMTVTSMEVAPNLSPMIGTKNTTNPLKIPKNIPALAS